MAKNKFSFKKALVSLGCVLVLALGWSVVGHVFVFNQPARAQSSGALTVEFGIDRPGDDYRDFDLPQPCAALCQRACAEDSDCVSYTYVKPGVQGNAARCWLKDQVPSRVSDSCCTSGRYVD